MERRPCHCGRKILKDGTAGDDVFSDGIEGDVRLLIGCPHYL
jgi:hypothetical protein